MLALVDVCIACLTFCRDFTTFRSFISPDIDKVGFKVCWRQLGGHCTVIGSTYQLHDGIIQFYWLQNAVIA